MHPAPGARRTERHATTSSFDCPASGNVGRSSPRRPVALGGTLQRKYRTGARVPENCDIGKLGLTTHVTARTYRAARPDRDPHPAAVKNATPISASGHRLITSMVASQSQISKGQESLSSRSQLPACVKSSLTGADDADRGSFGPAWIAVVWRWSRLDFRLALLARPRHLSRSPETCAPRRDRRRPEVIVPVIAVHQEYVRASLSALDETFGRHRRLPRRRAAPR